MKTQNIFVQVRIARPTDKLSEVIQFYREGLGLKEIGSFKDHEGYSGIMLGMPDENCHLEFTEHNHGSPCQAPTKDNLIVFYFPFKKDRDQIVNKLARMGYKAVEPENPYWETKGVTVEDPDGWRVVLMHSRGFNIDG